MFIAVTHIQQGDQSVDEYEAEFSKMVLFVDTVNGNEAHKAQAFFRGLNSRYREVIGTKPQTSYSEVIEQARRMELEFRPTAAREARIAGTRDANRDRKRTYEGGSGSAQQSEFKKSKSAQHPQQSSKINQSGSRSFSMPQSNSTSFIRPVPGQGLICFKCGQGHRASECDFSGSCDHCGKFGHMKLVCKQNPNSIIKWRLTSPLSTGSTVAIPSAEVPLGVSSSHGSVQMMAAPSATPPPLPAQPYQLPSHPYQHPTLGYYYHAPPLPAPYIPLQLPANPPQPQQLVADSSISAPHRAYNQPTTSSLGHHDGASGTK